MIYQPGNKVKIQNLKQDAAKFSKPGVGLTSEMVNLSNKIVTIVDAEYDDDIGEHIYCIDLDGTRYTWVAQYFYPPMVFKRKPI
mgnify:CR=1 FL=1